MSMKIERNIKKFFYDIYVDVTIVLVAFLYAVLHYKDNLWSIIGICLTCVSVVLWIIARIQLGDAFSVEPKARPLVVKGLYAKIQHPMYIFSFLATMGVLLMLQNMYLYIILPVMVVVQIKRITAENALLKKEYGSAYDAYAKNVWL